MPQLKFPSRSFCWVSVVALFLAAAVGSAADDPVADPVPLRRVLLPIERLPAELKKDGTLLRLPRDEFDRLLTQAGLAVKQRRTPPQLTEARYQAKLVAGPVLVGTAQWKTHHVGKSAALLRLQSGATPFNLAVKQPRFENRDALLAEFLDPDWNNLRVPAVLIDKPGEHTITLEWSARVDRRPDGWWTDLNFPECPVGSLELDLPADLVVSSRDETLISGPGPAELADRRVWRIATGGKTQLPLHFRRAGTPAAGSILFAELQMVQKLGLDGLEATATFSVETLGSGVRELSVEHDPMLRPVDVRVPGLVRWDKEGNDRIKVQLESPLRTGRIEVRCLAPWSKPDESKKRPKVGTPLFQGAWTSPSVRLVDAVPRGEMLELWFSPELRVTSWTPGAFRLKDSEDRNGGRRLVLIGGGLGGKRGADQRPRLVAQAGGVDFRVRQLSLWRLTSADMDFTSRLEYEVRQGSLFQVIARVPPGWGVESVESVPPDLVRSYTVKPDKAGPQFVADLRTPLAPDSEKGRQASFTVRLTPSAPTAKLGSEWMFPDLVPVGAALREGALAIDYDEQVHRAIVKNAAPLDPERDRFGLFKGLDAEGPWGKTVPDLFYPTPGENANARLILVPRVPRFRARTHVETVVRGSAAFASLRLLLEAESGSASSIDLELDADEPGLEWRSETPLGGSSRVRVERLQGQEVAAGLAALNASAPLSGAWQGFVLQAARPTGSLWRLHFGKPLPIRKSVLLTASRDLVPTGPKESTRWNIPLPALTGTAQIEGEVSVRLIGAEKVAVDQTNLRESSRRNELRLAAEEESQQETRPAWRRFRYHDARARLGLSTKALGTGPGSEGASEAVIDRARLTSVLTATGNLRHHFLFQVSRWPARLLPIQLPRDASLQALSIAGHWQSAIRPDEEGKLLLPVPVTTRGSVSGRDVATPGVVFELVYTTPFAPRLGWGKLPNAIPELPLQPIELKRLWLMPTSWRPLWDGAALLMPGAPERDGAWRSPRRLLAFAQSVPSWGPTLPLPGRRSGEPTRDELSPQRRLRAERQQALSDAVASLRRTTPRRPSRQPARLTLGELAEELVSGYFRTTHPLVIDTLALSQAGYSQTSELHRDELAKSREADKDDLTSSIFHLHTGGEVILLPTGPGIVLTTRRQSERWSDGELPPGALDAVATASEMGRSPLGRFLTATEWLARGPDLDLPTQFLQDEEELTNWSSLVPTAGTEESWLVSEDHVTGSGFLLGGLATGMLVFLGRSRAESRRRFFFLWVLLAGLGLIWLPETLSGLAFWPLVTAVLVAIPWFARWAVWREQIRKAGGTTSRGKPLSRLAIGISVLLVVGMGLGFGSHADGQPGPPTPREDAAPAETVYLVPALGNQPASVLVTPGLQEKLKRLAAPGLLRPGSGAVLSSAVYEGKIVNEKAEFEATFLAHNLGDEATTLELPLDGVQLVGDVLLNGARAFPTVLGPKAGYGVRLPSRGLHKVEVRFQAPIQVTPDELRIGMEGLANLAGMRQVRFSAPPLLQSRLLFTAPEGSKHLHAPVRSGLQRVTPEGKSDRLEAELGAMTVPLTVRWYQNGKNPRAPLVEHREAHFWDLRIDKSLLTSLFRYQISSGVVATLTAEIPPELEVRSVEARRPPAGKAMVATGLEPVRLSDWSVQNRTLRLEFPVPISGPVEVTLETVPKGPWTPPVVLPLPRPKGQPAPEGIGYLAYRLQGLKEDWRDHQRLTKIQPEDFAPFWPAATRPALLQGVPKGQGTYTAHFRLAEPAPEARLAISPAPVRLSAEQHLDLRIGPRQAEVTATLQLKAVDNDLWVVEWEWSAIQPLFVTSITGPGVSRWSQSNNRVLVWLNRTTTATNLDLKLTARMPLTPPSREKKSPASAETRLDLPIFRPVQAQTVRTRLTLSPTAGLTLVPGKWTGLKTTATTGREIVLEAQQPFYSGSLAVRPGPKPAVTVTTRAGIEGKELVFHSVIEYRLQGELRSALVRLRDWSGTAELTAPMRTGGSVTRTEQTRKIGTRLERAWSLDLTGVNDQYRIELKGRMPLEDALDGVPMPNVLVGGENAERRLVVESGLATEACSGLVPLPEKDDEAESWRVVREEWRMRLLPRELPRPAAPQVIATELRATVADGKRYLYEARWWLWQEGPGELNVRLPAAAVVAGVSLDGRPALAEGNRIWLPHSSAATGGPARQVLLRYHLPREKGLARPNLKPPELEGLAGGPVLWTVEVPPGWELQPSKGGRDLAMGATRRAGVEMLRAATQLELEKREREANAAESATPRRRAIHSLRLASLALDSGADPSVESLDAKGETLAARLQALRKRARVSGKSLSREEFGIDTGCSDPATIGTPYSREASAEGELRLAPESARLVRQALAVSGWWVLGLLAAWLVSLSRLLRAVVRILWPELALGAGLLGWYVEGPAIGPVFLVLLGGVGRLLILGAWGRRVWTRWATPRSLGSTSG